MEFTKVTFLREETTSDLLSPERFSVTHRRLAPPSCQEP